MESLGSRLKSKREECGLTLRELAKKSGLHFTQLSKIENGLNHPRVSTINKIADALGLVYEDLVSSKDQVFEELYQHDVAVLQGQNFKEYILWLNHRVSA